LLDTTIPSPAKRDGGFAGACTEPKTTDTRRDDIPTSGGGDAASLTRDEAEKSVLAENARTPTNYGVLVGQDTISLTPIEGRFSGTPHNTVERPGRRRKKSGHTNRTYTIIKG
jgi:hypothetical protein